MSSRVEIDLSAIEHNARVVERVIRSEDGAGAGSPGRGASVCAVLKQDAYGTGAARVAKRLTGLVDLFAVYSPEEAREIIEGAIASPILLLMPVRSIDRFDPVYRHASTGRLHLSIHDRGQLTEVEELASQLGVHLPVHVFVDTGMGRGGVSAGKADQLVASIERAPRLRLAGLMTHFASSSSDGSMTREQTRRFKAWLHGHEPIVARRDVMVHAADSAAVFRARRFHGTMVRAGLALHGYAGDGSTGEFEFGREASELIPSVRWTSSVVQVMDIPEGGTVGYGATWQARRASRIAIVPVGYAVGYPRALSNAGVVGLSGASWSRTPEPSVVPVGGTKYAPVVGRVSMDQVTVDVTDLPREMARVGAEVELIGVDRSAPNSMRALADAAETIVHDVLCGIGREVPRVYRSGSVPVVAERGVERKAG